MPALTSIARIALALAFCAVVAGGADRPLRAEVDPLAQVTRLNRQALDAVQKREFEKARELLKRALDLCHAAGLDRHPLAARTHVHMGVVIIEGFKIRPLGIQQFKRALEIAPDIAVTAQLSTPEIDDAFAEAKGDGAMAPSDAPPTGGETAAGDEAEPAVPAAKTPTTTPTTTSTVTPTAADAQERPRPARAVAAPPPSPAPEPVPPSTAAPQPSGGGILYHTVSDARQGRSIRITVNVDEALQFHRLVLAYRASGGSGFLGREMDPASDGAYSAEIPERATAGASVAYYIEAQNDDGQPVASRGSETRPLVIQLGEMAARGAGDGARSAASGSAAAPARGDAAARQRRGNGRGDDDDGGDDDDDNDDGGAGGDLGAGRWFAGLLVGSGIGYASGDGELNADTAVSGRVSAALLGHVAPELGYWLRRDLLLSAQARIQIVTGPTEIDANGRTYRPELFALALFAKLSWLFGAGHLHPFLSGGAGGGQIRHVVTLAALHDCGAARDQTCVDTVVAGPLLAELGGGLMYSLGSGVALVASTNVQAAGPRLSFNVDVNAGVGFSF
jgi:hypothetical protein